MITQADNKLPTYETFGEKLRVNFDEQEIIVKDMDGNEKVVYQYTTAESSIASNRSQLISDIIGSKYTIGGEFAAINNAESDPQEYSEYQAFRAQAKHLADEWLNKGDE
jgi:hypothetical protein